MRKYQITFNNGSVRIMTAVNDDIDPLAEVAKWPHEDGFSANDIANIEEV